MHTETPIAEYLRLHREAAEEYAQHNPGLFGYTSVSGAIARFHEFWRNDFDPGVTRVTFDPLWESRSADDVLIEVVPAQCEEQPEFTFGVDSPTLDGIWFFCTARFFCEGCDDFHTLPQEMADPDVTEEELLRSMVLGIVGSLFAEEDDLSGGPDPGVVEFASSD